MGDGLFNLPAIKPEPRGTQSPPQNGGQGAGPPGTEPTYFFFHLYYLTINKSLTVYYFPYILKI